MEPASECGLQCRPTVLVSCRPRHLTPACRLRCAAAIGLQVGNDFGEASGHVHPAIHTPEEQLAVRDRGALAGLFQLPRHRQIFRDRMGVTFPRLSVSARRSVGATPPEFPVFGWSRRPQ